jgi:urea carboxylase-associated protein 2
MTHIGRSAEEIAANRARYEEHQKRGLEFAPKALPEPSMLPAPALDGDAIIHQETIPGGWYWSTLLRRGEAIRVDQAEGGSTVALVAWNAADTTERLNLVDTAKVQWTTALGKGRVLFSDMGRIMFSLVEDSAGAHDCLMGGSTAATNAQKYPGENTRNTRDNLILLASKLGLDRRDIPGPINLFAPVSLDESGCFHWRPKRSNSGDYAELRAEMDMLVGFSNCPHPLDPNPLYAPQPVTITRFRAVLPTRDDLARTATAEAIRGFENNALALA